MRACDDTVNRLQSRIDKLEAADAARVAAEALEAQETAEHDAEFDVLAAAVETLNTTLQTVADDAETVATEAGLELASIEARLEWLMDDYIDGKGDLLVELIKGGDLEDPVTGTIAHVPSLLKNIGESTLNWEDYFKLVTLDEADRPPAKDHLGKPVKYAVEMALRADPDTGEPIQVASYRINSPKDQLLCPGVYRFRIWLKRSADYDGHILFLHFRFNNKANPACERDHSSGEICEAYAYDSRPTKSSRAVSQGLWPDQADEWILAEVGFKLKNPANGFGWFIGYPGKGTAGSVHFTGMSVVRLGGEGAC